MYIRNGVIAATFKISPCHPCDLTLDLQSDQAMQGCDIIITEGFLFDISTLKFPLTQLDLPKTRQSFSLFTSDDVVAYCVRTQFKSPSFLVVLLHSTQISNKVFDLLSFHQLAMRQQQKTNPFYTPPTNHPLHQFDDAKVCSLEDSLNGDAPCLRMPSCYLSAVT